MSCLHLSCTNLDWVQQVAVGAADMLVDQLASIKALRQQGAQQLAADLEYFCNVLSALGVGPPAAIATWQVRYLAVRLIVACS